MDRWVELAKRAVEQYVRNGERIPVSQPTPEGMERRSGVFVSLKKDGRLRGCIGTYLPRESNVAEEIVSNAIKSATADPRFPSVQQAELSDLQYTVDVLTEPTECRPEELDPRRYGAIVESGTRRGLLLPDLPGVDTVEQQLAICRRKAGIPPDGPIHVSRFTVERHQE